MIRAWALLNKSIFLFNTISATTFCIYFTVLNIFGIIVLLTEIKLLHIGIKIQQNFQLDMVLSHPYELGLS